MGDAAGSASPEADGSALDAQALDHLRTCRTCFGQGAKGLILLRNEVEAVPGAPWVRRVPLGDAVKCDSLSCLRYLVDEVKVETLNEKCNGYTPLQLSVIWGKPSIMVFLLARGADPMLDRELSIVDMARLRQQRLQEALEQSGDGAEFEGFSITTSRIEPLIEEGCEILQVLEGVEAQQSYQAWAELNGSHPLVKRFSGDVNSAEPRYQLSVLRALVLAGRGALLPAARRAELAAEEAAREVERAREEQPLMDALVEAGFSVDTAKEIRDTFRTPTIKALRNARLSPEDIEARLEAPVRQRRMMEGERRKFARFARELMEPAAGPSKAPAKAAAKSKAKAAPAAKAALLAMSKAAAKGGSAKSLGKEPSAKKTTHLDGMALLFREGLPKNAFAIAVYFLIGI